MVLQLAGTISINLPLSVAERSSRGNQVNTLCLIQAYIQVICAAAYFCEGGGRCFAESLFGTPWWFPGLERVLTNGGFVREDCGLILFQEEQTVRRTLLP